MGKALIAIIVGIGIIVYNHMSADSMLVLRGTGIDFGYIAIGYGIVAGIMSLVKKKEQPVEAAQEAPGEDS